MKLQTVHAIYKDGRLLVADPRLEPKGLKEVVLTYVDSTAEVKPAVDPIKALRGHGKGQRLTQRLLESRREDREREERSHRPLRSC